MARGVMGIDIGIGAANDASGFYVAESPAAIRRRGSRRSSGLFDVDQNPFGNSTTNAILQKTASLPAIQGTDAAGNTNAMIARGDKTKTGVGYLGYYSPVKQWKKTTMGPDINRAIINKAVSTKLRDDQIWSNSAIVARGAVKKRAARDIHIGKFSTSPLKTQYSDPSKMEEIFEADVNLFSLLDKAGCATIRI